MAIEPADYCEGFFFRYFIAGSDALPEELDEPNDYFLQAEEFILLRFNEVLKYRQDLLEWIACLPNGLEIHLYQGEEFKDHEDETYFFGRTTFNGDESILEFAIDEVLMGGRPNHDVLDVIAHELMHVLDFIHNDDDESEGMLPGLTDEEIDIYIRARDLEIKKIKTGKSPIGKYALTNHMEFLAVLAEVFMQKPLELKESSPILYEFVRRFLNYPDIEAR